MPRPRPTAPLALATLLALPILAGGCYSYDTAVRNASAQSVQITILKGTRQREIGNAVLAPGGSIGWSGATNGPVLARVVSQGIAHDIELPRRALTTIDVYDSDVEVTIAGVEQDAPQVVEQDAPADAQPETQTDTTESHEAPATDEVLPAIELDESTTEEPATEEIIDLIEDPTN
ncbi:MAG: hypothetical protein Q9O74_05255 [Planctomycetota bacterium]|nr:hypothetical protein [Planctomycetota bacterium]